MKYTLRKYQETNIGRIRKQFSSGVKRVLLVEPTGAGKTVEFVYIAENAAERDKQVLILVHRAELLNQCSAKLTEMGVEHGKLIGKNNVQKGNVLVGSVQTVCRRLDKIRNPDVIILDEAHHAPARSFASILEHFSDAYLLGVTATPMRLDRRGLKRYFDSMIVAETIRDLIDSDYLCQPIVYAPNIGIDVSRIKSQYGDYDKGAVEDAFLDDPKIIGDVVRHYRRYSDGLPAIAFCATVKHADEVARRFREEGIASDSIDGGNSDDERVRKIEALGNGSIKVLTSCELISEGVDIPIVSTAILLRPTHSLGLYMQQVGRVLRPYTGKSHAVILDHVGNVFRFGLPDIDRKSVV